MDVYRMAQKPVEVTRDDEGKPTKLRGYGAVFYNPTDPKTEFRMGEKLVERIHSRAFADLPNYDVRSMFNHDPNFLLGRTTAGTMRVGVDDTGVWYETDLPQTQAGRDVAESVDRGDVDGSSFWFSVDPVSYEIRTEDGIEVMDLVSVDTVREMGPVVFPAFEATTAQMRSDGAAEALKQNHQQNLTERERAEMSIFMIDHAS